MIQTRMHAWRYIKLNKEEFIRDFAISSPEEVAYIFRQAEVSFKAGYDKALAQLAEMTEECKQMGRREVVEWVESDGYEVNQIACSLGDIPVFLVHKERWQAQKKEWGIDEKVSNNIC